MDLPAGAHIRLSMQWRESHDQDFFFRPGEFDVYRLPLMMMKRPDLPLGLLKELRRPGGVATDRSAGQDSAGRRFRGGGAFERTAAAPGQPAELLDV